MRFNRSYSGYKAVEKWSVALLAVILVAAAVAGSACTGADNAPTATYVP